MFLRRHRSRIFAAVMAAIQLVAPAIAVIGDARIEARSVPAQEVAHVEDVSAVHTWLAHLDDCDFCRILKRHAAPSQLAVGSSAGLQIARLQSADDWSTSRAARAAPNSRAPPAA